MPWTAPKTWVVDELVTAQLMNTHLRDNLIHLAEVGQSFTVITHEETQGTDAPQLVANTWNTRPLNQKYGDASNLITLASNQVTLDAGTYAFFADAPAYNVYYHQLRLYDHTASIPIAYGSPTRSQTDLPTTSTLATVATFATTTTLELQHNCSSTNNINGMGRRSNLGTEVYARLLIWRIR